VASPPPPRCRRSALSSSYGYTCDIFPFTYPLILSVNTRVFRRIYHTYSSVSMASPSRTLSSPSLSRARSLIQLADFSILFSLASSVVLFLCLVVSPFPSFPLFFSFSFLFLSFLLFQSLVYSVHWYDGVNLIPSGYIVERGLSYGETRFMITLLQDDGNFTLFGISGHPSSSRYSHN
jgi:hypothetical protein